MGDLSDDRLVALLSAPDGAGIADTHRMVVEISRYRRAADRAITIADEAFGFGPVEPLDATLGRIERGIHEQVKELRAVRERHGAESAEHDSTRASLGALLQATAADKDRVRQVVGDAVEEVYEKTSRDPCGADDAAWRLAVADRCAEQLAQPAVRLSADDVSILETLRYDSAQPEHNEDCHDCSRKRRVIALLDRLIAGGKP